MTNSRWCTWLIAALCAVPTAQAELPDSQSVYAGLNPASVSYVGGSLTVRWDDTIEVLSAHVETGFQEAISPIQSGVPIRYEINATAGLVPVNAFGLARRRSDGHEFRFFTRIWDPACRLTIPPTADSRCVRPFGGCTHTETADCWDGTKISVTCEGTQGCGGSHVDERPGRAGGGRAGCRAESVSEDIENGATVVATLVTEKSKTCPPPPPKDEGSSRELRPGN